MFDHPNGNPSDGAAAYFAFEGADSLYELMRTVNTALVPNLTDDATDSVTEATTLLSQAQTYLADALEECGAQIANGEANSIEPARRTLETHHNALCAYLETVADMDGRQALHDRAADLRGACEAYLQAWARWVSPHTRAPGQTVH